MIEKIILKNFESHVDTTVDFRNGVTIISGNSSQGKSGIFRALRFVFLNSSEGEDSINYNADETSVELHYNNHIIKRVRNRKTKNEYWLDGECYKAFGQSVPDDIQKVFNLNPINFEWQFDKRPFLLSETGGYISNKLNEIVDLELIDTSAKSIEQDRRACNKKKELFKSNLEALKPEMLLFDWIKQAEIELNEIIKLEEKVVKQAENIENICNLSNTYKILIETYGKIGVLKNIDIINTEANIDNYLFAEVILKEFTSLYTQILESKNSLSDIVFIDDVDIDNLSHKISNFTILENNLLLKEENYNILLMLYDKIDNIKNIINNRRIDRLENDINSYIFLQSKLLEQKQISKTHTDTEYEIKLIMDEISALKKEYELIAPEECPLCGAPMDKVLV